jgi:hypothetical protein
MSLPAIRRGATRMMNLRRGGGGYAPPPFVRLPPPSAQLPKEVELLWNDPVAPEITIDFDAPHLSPLQALGMFSLAFGSLLSTLAFMVFVVDPPSKKPSIHRELPFDGLNRELGDYARPPVRKY